MPLDPIEVELSNGQKLEVLKRFRQQYLEELERLDHDIRDIKTALAEYEFVVQYLGEQPEVLELKGREEELAQLEKRRAYLGKLLDRLDQSLPKQSGDKPATFQKY